jgi:protein-S-isoprenylcysteine O-methyltransferase Ste14
MGYWLRHALAVLLLPVTVTVVVPLWIAGEYRVSADWPTTGTDLALVLAGAIVLVIGQGLFGASLHHFFMEGKGTLAPWDPPRRLVVRGPYRYVRNPMITGVLFTLAGLSLVLRSGPHAVWAGIFAAMNAIVIPVMEEPLLERRFGEDYREYCRHVRRFVPRRKAWTGGRS